MIWIPRDDASIMAEPDKGSHVASDAPAGAPAAASARTLTPERQQTDAGLRTERANTDRALAEKVKVERAADGVVQRARADADETLSLARDEADRRDEIAPGSATHGDVVDARREQDATLRDERAIADQSLQRERAASARALAQLFPLERANTDRFLLTERARSDDALSIRDDFLGMVSHDLRDLLGGIVLSADVLQRTAAADATGEQTRAATVRIQRYAARMNRLIGDLLDIASIDAGKLSVTPKCEDWTALVNDALDTFRPLAQERGLVLELDSRDGQVYAQFDHDRMLQVLANLISNAIKFTPRGGTIRIGSALVGEALHVSVSDSGGGIPAHLLESVFERFWQAGENDRRGIGLGLYISRQIVEAHGGRIWAESTVGEGSQLRFELPAPARG